MRFLIAAIVGGSAGFVITALGGPMWAVVATAFLIGLLIGAA